MSHQVLLGAGQVPLSRSTPLRRSQLPLRRRPRRMINRRGDLTASATSPAASTTPSSVGREIPDQFLSPISLEEPTTKPGPNPSPSGFRCSDNEFLLISLPDYLSLLEWTVRQLHGNKRGRTPQGVKPILERLGVDFQSVSDVYPEMLLTRIAHLVGTSPAFSRSA